MTRIFREGDDVHIAAVIPAFNVGGHIAAVLREIPEQIRTVIVVDDGSTDDTAAVVEQCAATDGRIQPIRHDRNRGIGAAMVTGFARSLELKAAVVVKIDGDGQMPLSMLPKLLHPLIIGDADYAKGNRFQDFQAIRKMPPLRRFGNVVLSFLAKVATGYWQCFDPTNGFVAIRSSVLSQLPLERIDPTYFFEISILSHLYLLGAVVREEPMPARYEGEPSNLSIPVVIRDFPLRLLSVFLRRIFLKNFLYDFSVETIEISAGVILLFVGTVYGGYNWLWHALHRVAAPTGTVVLSALMIMLGFQLLLSAISLDLQSVPRQPINEGSLVRRPRVDPTVRRDDIT